MVQLSSDCFAFGGGLAQLDAALEGVLRELEPISGFEQVPLTQSGQRILAENVVALEDVPPDNNSAVDGFAVFFDDLNIEGSTELPVVGRAAAGKPYHKLQKRGEAVQIFTGAIMPSGTGVEDPDTVFMQEDCKSLEGRVILPSGIKRGSNCRAAGEDIRSGNCILREGLRLRPQEVGLAASVGRIDLRVRSRLRVAIFSTGDEVMEPGGSRETGKIYDSNRYTLITLLKTIGCSVEDLGVLPDNPDVISTKLLKAASEHDLIVTSGGVSTGEEDHVKRIIDSQGRLFFWRLAIKPGRPVALGEIKNTLFIGLPGNPVAAMVTFLRVARPIILKLAGASNLFPKSYFVSSGFRYKKKPERREYIRVSTKELSNGRLVAEKFSREGAGILSSMVFADGLVELVEGSLGVEKGDLVRYFPFKEFDL